MVRTLKCTALAVLALLFVGFAAQTALAVEGAGQARGSALIFPYYNITSGYRTYMRVTLAPPANAVGTADVALHNFYFESFQNPFTNAFQCREFDRFRPVTVNDAEIWDVRSEAPNVTRGFAMTYLVDRAVVGGILTFGGQLGWDALFGDTVILNSTEGWLVVVPAISVPYDPNAGQPALNVVDPGFVLAHSEGTSFFGPDGDAVDYRFVTFGNHFSIHFFNPRIGVDPTEVVILPFSIFADPFTPLGSYSWVQPREAYDGATNQWSWFGDWFDHEENQHNIPFGRISCWGIRTVDELTLNGASTAPAGYGWLRLLTTAGFNVYAPGGQMAVLFQLEDPVPNSGFGWGFYPFRQADNLVLFTADPFGLAFFPYAGNGGKTTVERWF